MLNYQNTLNESLYFNKWNSGDASPPGFEPRTPGLKASPRRFLFPPVLFLAELRAQDALYP